MQQLIKFPPIPEWEEHRDGQINPRQWSVPVLAGEIEINVKIGKIKWAEGIKSINLNIVMHFSS